MQPRCRACSKSTDRMRVCVRERVKKLSLPLTLTRRPDLVVSGHMSPVDRRHLCTGFRARLLRVLTELSAYVRERPERRAPARPRTPYAGEARGPVAAREDRRTPPGSGASAAPAPAQARFLAVGHQGWTQSPVRPARARCHGRLGRA